MQRMQTLERLQEQHFPTVISVEEYNSNEDKVRVITTQLGTWHYSYKDIKLTFYPLQQHYPEVINEDHPLYKLGQLFLTINTVERQGEYFLVTFTNEKGYEDYYVFFKDAPLHTAPYLSGITSLLDFIE